MRITRFVPAVSALMLLSVHERTAMAQPSVPVMVRNTASNPVPVAAMGTTAIAGSVAVTSLPNVQLAGPVAVSSLPNVQLAGPVAVSSLPNVQLAGPLPAPASHLGVKPTQFVQLKVFGAQPDNKFFNATTSDDENARIPFVTPQGKVLVLTDFSVNIDSYFSDQFTNVTFRIDIVEWWNPDPGSITGRVRYQMRASTDKDGAGGAESHLTSGILIPAGRGVNCTLGVNQSASAYGYLIDAQ